MHMLVAMQLSHSIRWAVFSLNFLRKWCWCCCPWWSFWIARESQVRSVCKYIEKDIEYWKLAGKNWKNGSKKFCIIQLKTYIVAIDLWQRHIHFRWFGAHDFHALRFFRQIHLTAVSFVNRYCWNVSKNLRRKKKHWWVNYSCFWIYTIYVIGRLSFDFP